ncbi:MAG: hypothetical protein CMP28_14230, partial [Roseibacillus sp.]|nr:hypothetical protein [Roseibacillus sp.]
FAAQKILEAIEAIGEPARDISPVLITAAQRRQMEEEKRRVIEKEKERKAKEELEIENKKRKQEENRLAAIRKRNAEEAEEAEQERERNEIRNRPPSRRAYYASQRGEIRAAILPMIFYPTCFFHFPLFILLKFGMASRDDVMFLVVAGGSAATLLILLILVACYLGYGLKLKNLKETFLCWRCNRGFAARQEFGESHSHCPHCGTVNTIPGDYSID